MQGSRGIRRMDEFPDSHFPIRNQGFRSRNSFFSDFFDKDPFDDPFFSQPFGSMFPSMGENNEPLHHRQSRRRFDRGLEEQQQGSRGVVIEEIGDDEEDAQASRSRSHPEPIVEHADDLAVQRENSVDGRDRRQHFSQGFYFSSVTYGGPYGTYYNASAMRRTGGDGLFEEVREENDSINGHEMNQILHGLGGRGHAVTRKKSANGKEDYVETLHNLNDEDKKDFDETWKKQAKKYLPGFHKGLGMLLKNKNSEQDDSKSAASSSSTKPHKHLTWNWPWARKA